MSDVMLARYKLVRNEPGYLDVMCIQSDGKWTPYAEAAARIRALEARLAAAEGLARALAVCNRVLHFDLENMIAFGDDYNQAVADAAHAARTALSAWAAANPPTEGGA